MTYRAVLLGLLLGLGVSGLTYYNDWVIRQTYLIGNHLPASVFGVGMLLLLLSGLMWRGGKGRPFSAGEIAVVMALGLAACGWPGSNLFRYFSYPVTLPIVQENLQPNWQATRVMSYVPGGSPLLAEGYVRDWPELVQQLKPIAASPTDNNTSTTKSSPVTSLGARLHQRFDELFQRRLSELQQGDLITARDRERLVRQINTAMSDPTLLAGWSPGDVLLSAQAQTLWQQLQKGQTLTTRQTQQLHRLVMQAVWPGVLRAQAAGSGVLLADGDADAPAVQTLVTRTGDWAGLSVLEVPWSSWWPVIRLWGGTALLLGVASMGLVLVVHPQWYQRELLPYPTVKFVEEITRRENSQRWPTIVQSRLFWVALGVVALVHLINGLNLWYPEIPRVQRQFDFNGLRVLFPDAARVYGAEWLFAPTLFASAIGFAFFIPTRVSLSLGLSLFFWVAFGAWLRPMGLTLEADRYNIGASGTNLRFGAYLAATVMMLYVGRRHYFLVLRAALGFARHHETPVYSMWGARLMVAACAGCVFLLHGYAGLDLLLATMLVLATMMIFLVLSRLNAETGLFYAQPDWLPGVMLAGLIGLPALGPEALIIVMLASMIWVVDPREAVAPYLLNGLAMTQQVGKVRSARSAGWLMIMLVTGFAVALMVTLTLQYNLGLQRLDNWSMNMGSFMFNRVSAGVAQLSAMGELDASMELQGWARWWAMMPEQNAGWWCLTGFALLLVCSVARLRLSWWPIHPVLFLVWGSYPANFFAFSFLLGSLMKGVLVWVGGEKAYHRAKPLAVGLIAGELLLILFWAIVGLLYYLNTGIAPKVYRILPG